MKLRENVLRAKHFQLEAARRRAAQVETMVAELDRMAAELDQQILHEERRAGISDPTHFAYPTFARAARQRRDNLAASVRDLALQRERAVSALADAEADHAAVLARLERTEERAGEDGQAAGRRLARAR
jgi:F0F1-type ATP synthase membrane subunit b/b'